MGHSVPPTAPSEGQKVCKNVPNRYHGRSLGQPGRNYLGIGHMSRRVILSKDLALCRFAPFGIFCEPTGRPGEQFSWPGPRTHPTTPVPPSGAQWNPPLVHPPPRAEMWLRACPGTSRAPELRKRRQIAPNNAANRGEFTAGRRARGPTTAPGTAHVPPSGVHGGARCAQKPCQTATTAGHLASREKIIWVSATCRAV